MKKYNRWISFIALAVLYSCSGTKKASVNTDVNNLKFTAEAAPDWTNLLDRKKGWFGSDGIFAIPATGNDNTDATTDITLLFGDSMIGEVIDNQPPQPGYVMVHNSVALLKGNEPKEENIKFYWKKTASGNEGTFFVPRTSNTKSGDYYWLGDGFVNPDLDDKTYIFCYRIRDQW